MREQDKKLTEKVSEFKKDARRDFEDAVSALIALAYRHHSQGANFLWDSDPVLERECNAILRGLSERVRDAAKRRAVEIIEDEGWDEDAWDEIDKGSDSDSMLWRLDMAASHLRSLLEIWIAIAFVEGMTQAYLKICILRYISNPYMSPMWSRLPAGLLKWGKGYQKDIFEQIALIGTDAIVGAVRLAEWIDAMERGADYYIRRRGSNYDCDVCEEVANVPIPIDVPWDYKHPRCMCYAEYHFSKEQ